MEQETLQKLKDLDSKFNNRLEELLLNRIRLTGKQDRLKKELDELKQGQDMIDSEVSSLLINAGKDTEAIYSTGFRLGFKPEYVGSIENGKEVEFLDWCKEHNHHDLGQVKVGKRVLTSCVDQGVKLPEMLNVTSFSKFSVRKDTRKK